MKADTLVNWHGTRTLLLKEIRRFTKVLVQTVLTPVVTAMLYLVVFHQVLENRVHVYPGVGFTAFLVPGLIMMSVLQNSFANSASSITQSKMMGNLVFMLLAPISAVEAYFAFVTASVLRGVMVATGIYLASMYYVHLPLRNPPLIIAFVLLGSGVLGGIGLIAGVLAERFEHMSAFQNFVILPLSFLSGVFYSIHQLPPLAQQISRFNPFFYMIDGFRHGFLGVSDVSPGASLIIVAAFFALVSAVGIGMLHRGYKLRQ
ncbi:MAG TPA: ABC transporter permease [Gammaproteobacteria bacterium]|nr:ABC transporter permease [Gammaproteobacteria bacterium]